MRDLMHYTGEISLGTILTIVTLIGIAVRLGYTVGKIQTTVMAHANRLDKYEITLLQIVGDVQRLIGRVEGVVTREDHWRKRE